MRVTLKPAVFILILTQLHFGLWYGNLEAQSAGSIRLVPGPITNKVMVEERAEKICQLVGDYDRERQEPTLNLTYPFHGTINNLFLTIKKTGVEHPFDYKYDFVTHKIQDYYKKAKIKDANLNSLRKTFGSRLLQKKVSIFMVQSYLDINQ